MSACLLVVQMSHKKNAAPARMRYLACMRHVVFLFIGLLLFPSFSLAQAPIVGDVEGGAFKPLPIAIPDVRLAPGFQEKKNAAAQLVQIVRRDLLLSGAFHVLDAKSFIDTDGTTLPTVRFADWSNVGALGLVKMQISAAGVEIHGFSVADAKENLSKVFSGSMANAVEIRHLAHDIANEIFRSYTGEPGVFRTQVVFVKRVQGEKHIFVMDMDGENQRQITKTGGLNLLPYFASDGRSILLTSYKQDNPDLYEITVNGDGWKKISARAGLNTGGRISPDGKHIVLTLSQDGNSEIYLLDRSGGNPQRLTQTWGIDTSPTWSPDGKQIAFVSSRAGTPQIYVMNADGSNVKRLTFQGTYNQTPAYSPRGTHIAFTARDEKNNFDVFLYEIKTGQITRVTQGQGNNEEPTFAPNGRLLMFSTTRNGGRQLVVSTLDGTQQTVVTASGEFSSPSWGPFSSP